MQVTPIAAKDTAKKFKATYDVGRLLSDPVYNMQMGAAELSNLISGYRGSYMLTFAGYNAGRGRVRQWIAAHGDPRESENRPDRLGRDASRSPRHATMCSGSWKTFRFIAPASAAAPSC